MQILHLLFANDSLLFCEATFNDCHKLLSILGANEEASGQAVNQHKTTLFFGQNRRSETREEIRSMLGAQVMMDYDKYLGLPIVGGKSKVNTFKELQEKITKRVMGWKEKNISKVGREVLIRNVAQAIPTYSMSLFKIPKTICDGINSAFCKYWWVQTHNEKKIHWINWSKLCGSKRKGEWGSGIYMLSTWQCWPNKHGGYLRRTTHYFIEYTKLTTSLHAHSWMLSWDQTPSLFGEACFRPVR